jgi:hypothetical protein
MNFVIKKMKKNVELKHVKMFNSKYLLLKNNLIQWLLILKIKMIYKLERKDKTLLF